jgi:hypothetical protein
MREVNPDQINLNTTIKDVLSYLVQFIKNPADKIKHLPQWSWTSLFVLQLTLSVVSGVFSGLLKLNDYRVLFGLLLMPVVSTVAALLLSTFFYYYFQFFEDRTESFRKILTFVILASIPFFIFQILSEYFRVVSLIGFAFTSLLAIIGLKENFRVDKKRAVILVSILFGLALFTFAYNQYSTPNGISN